MKKIIFLILAVVSISIFSGCPEEQVLVITTPIITNLSLDTSFGSGGVVVFNSIEGGGSFNSGNSITLDSANNIYITGTIRRGGPVIEDMYIWKYNSSGSLDTSFDGDGIVNHTSSAAGWGFDYGFSIVMDSVGNIYITGESINDNYKPAMVIWKYNSIGSLVTSFGTDGMVVNNNANIDYGQYGSSIVLDSNENIYVTGSILDENYNGDMVIWKYNINGSLDTSFDGDGIVVHNSAAGGNNDDSGWAMALDSEDNIYITGTSTNGSGGRDMVVWKYMSNGSLDTSFGTDGIVVRSDSSFADLDTGTSIVLDSAGNIYVAGFSAVYKWTDMIIWKFTSSGVLDTSFGTNGIVVSTGIDDGLYGGNCRGDAITLDSNGDIYVTGSGFNGNDHDMIIWKCDSSGSFINNPGTYGLLVHDSAAGGNGIDEGKSIILDSNGNIYVTGSSEIASAVGEMAIWKYH